MNKFYTTLASTLLVGAAATAIAADIATTPQQAVTMQRRERPARISQPAKSIPVTHVKGGESGDKPLYGMLTDCYDGPLWGWSGPVQIGDNGTFTQLTETSIPNFNACYFEDYILVINMSGESGTTWSTYDTRTWERSGATVTFVLGSEYTFPQTMTYDPVSKTIYACVVEDTWGYVNSAVEFASIDLSNALDPVRRISSLDVYMRALATDKDGTIYGIGKDGVLYTINKFDGSIEKVTDIDFPVFEGDPNESCYFARESAVIDWETGKIYFSYSDSEFDTFLITIDKATGATEVVENYGYWSGGTENCEIFGALWFEQKVAVEAGTPADVTDFNVVANGAELSATATFTLPLYDTDGNALAGLLEWNVSAGAEVIAEGTGNAGESVSVQLPVASPDTYNFVLSVSSNGLTGTPVSVMSFVGPDTPQITGLPYFITTGDGMGVVLRWNEAVGAHDGVLAEPLTYRIVRYPDEVTVAEAATGKQFVDNIDSEILTKYMYKITPKAGEIEGDAVNSREAYAGIYFSLPHVMDFTKGNNNDIFDLYPVNDANNDDAVWYMHNLYGITCPGAGEEMDDYLFVGPFNCKAGSLYSFKFSVSNRGRTNETLAVYAGTDPEDINSLKSAVVVPQTDIEFSHGVYDLFGDFVPETDGLYYFAIHGCTPSSSYGFDISNLSVTEATNETPASVSSLTVVPTADHIELTFVLPKVNIDGNPTEIDAVNIYRDGALLATVSEGIAEALAADGELTYSDYTAPQGMHNYEVKCVNGAGEGAPAAINCWAGLDVPGFVPNFRIYEYLSDPGTLHLTWDAPTVGKNGGYINPETLEYKINWLGYDIEQGTGNRSVGNTLSYDMVLSGVTKQSIISVTLYASNEAGEDRTMGHTKSCYFGPALSLPLFESWANMKSTSGIWSGQSLIDDFALFESYWDVSDGALTSFSAQDGDGGMILVSTTVDGGAQRMRAPRVDISGAENPTAVFYYYYTPETSEMYVEIMVEDQPVKLLADLDLSPENAGKWNRAEISLADYRSTQYIQLSFVGRASKATEGFAAIDNFSITDFKAHDLMIAGFVAPTKADINTEVTMQVSVRNNGVETLASGEYSVSLYKNGVFVSETSGLPVAPDQIVSIELSDMAMVTDPESTEYYVEINYTADENAANNRSASRFVRILTGTYPRVTDLSAEENDGVILTWSDPDSGELYYEPVVETWDQYPAFSIDGMGDWTVYDGDGMKTARLALSLDGVLEYPNAGEPMAWQVFDPETLNIFLNPWYARSGSQFLVSMQAYDANGTLNGVSDDWLISPELFGGAQTISFYATASHNNYSPEILDIMISTTGNNPEDFEVFEAGVEVNYAKDWTEFFFNLPEGTRYFALVHKSVGKLALLLDDVRYIPAAVDSGATLELEGFNVYRNGERLNSELVTEYEYIDRTVVSGQDYRYNVTAVWTQGESGLSNTVSLKVSGIDGTSVDVTISAVQGAVRVATESECDVKVYTTSGVCIASVQVDGVVEIPVAVSGIYLVQCGDKVAKLSVK